MIPALETKRLVLRGPEASDFESIAAFLASERSCFVGGPTDRMTAWRYFSANVGQWHLTGYGLWTAERRDSGAAIGLVGLFYPEGWIAREIAWMITDPAAEGRGFAREAAEAARDFAYRRAGWREVFSVIAPENHRSVALARRLGCILDREATIRDGIPVGIWRHPAPGALAMEAAQ